MNFAKFLHFSCALLALPQALFINNISEKALQLICHFYCILISAVHKFELKIKNPIELNVPPTAICVYSVR